MNLDVRDWKPKKNIGGRLAAVTLTHPDLFPVKPTLNFAAFEELMEEDEELEGVAAQTASGD